MSAQSTSLPAWKHYGAAIALVVFAAALRVWPLRSLGSNLEWLTFYPAVMIAAIYGGFYAGILAALLSCITATLFWPFIVANPFVIGFAHQLGMFVFILNGVLVSGVAEAMLRAQSRAIKAQEQANAANQSRVLFENSPTGMVAIDPNNGHIVQANEFELEMVGYNAEEILTKTVADLTYPEDRAESQQRYEKLSQGLADRLCFEKRYLRKDGSYFWAETSISALKDADGKISIFIGNTIDITKRKRAEEELNKIQQLLNETEQIGKVGGWEFYIDTGKLIWSKGIYHIHEVDVTYDLTLEKGINFYAPASRPVIKQAVSRAIEHSEPFDVELEIITAKGNLRSVHAIGETDLDHRRVYGFFQDITESKQAELALIESKQRYRSLFENMLEGYAHCKMLYEDDLPHDFIYLDVNRKFEELTGLNDVVGKKVSKVIPGIRESNPELFDIYGRVAISGQPEKFETYVDTLGIWFSISVYSPRQEHFVAVFDNITTRKQAELALRLERDSNQMYLDTMQTIMVALNTEGRITMINRAGCELLGFDQSELLGHYWFKKYLPQPEGMDVVYPRFQQIIAGDLSSAEYYENNVLRRDGTMRLIAWRNTYITDNDGRNVGTLSAGQDITEHKKAESELRIAATAFESQEGMLITDANGIILRANRAFTAITGYTAEEVIGKGPRILSSGRQDANFYAAMWKSINSTGVWEGEIWNRRKNGEIYPEHLSITAVKDSAGKITNYVAAFADITLRKAAEEEILNLAFYDPLTKLPNRRLLQDRLKQALASSVRNGRQGALLFIDLDNFKSLNDTHGHLMGDLLLQQIGQRLASCVREGDTVSRFGGDEFVVILEDLSEQALEAAGQTEVVGEKILATLNQPYLLAAHEYHNTVSIGVTTFNDHQTTIDELFKQADIAMYQAKNSGRNTLRFFDRKMQDIVNSRSEIEWELRKAVENQQFNLYYQIQMDSSHRAVGAEALIRWIHPERGLVSPAQFIPISEETGLILPIGQWVLETACIRLKAWQQDVLTRNLVLSVNVSAKQLRQANFVAQVQALVQNHSINPKLLKLEITESMLLEDIEDTIATMSALKATGVQFSLDDFGTGYSSLQYLKRLPLDQLKIDQSFVRDIAIDGNDRAIVQTIIAMAQSLNLSIIAEGVETEEQKKILTDKGCSHYQGYLFGKPVPIKQFEEMLKQESDTFHPVDHTAMMLRLS